MKYLTMLSPAETLLVLRRETTTLNEFLKVTLWDLLYKSVLQTLQVSRQPSPHDPPCTFIYIVKGEYFDTYKPLPHEGVFLSPFPTNNGIEILFRHLVKIAYQNAGSRQKFLHLVSQSEQMKTCFSQTKLQKIFGGYSITANGLALEKDLAKELAELEARLPYLLESGKEKVLEIYRQMKGNMLLIQGIELTSLSGLDKQLWEEVQQEQNMPLSASCSGTFSSFDSYSESFDSSCGGDSNGGDSGGDGCSGCGGCGGD